VVCIGVIITLYVVCGYTVSKEDIETLNEYYNEKKYTKLDVNIIVDGLNYLKELEMMNDKEGETDDYCKFQFNNQSGCVCSVGRAVE
jgi:hypothetical protein